MYTRSTKMVLYATIHTPPTRDLSNDMVGFHNDAIVVVENVTSGYFNKILVCPIEQFSEISSH